MLSLNDSSPGQPLLLYDEPIYLNDKIIGRTTSGNYSFNYNKNLSFGYVKSEYSNEELGKMDLYIEVAKKKYLAKVELNPLKGKKARFL
jgi:4-methylaminobutanoate oxidase (formaldehyde-forming)